MCVETGCPAALNNSRRRTFCEHANTNFGACSQFKIISKHSLRHNYYKSMKRCYCGHSGGSFAGSGSILKSTSHISRRQQPEPPEQPRPRSDLLSLTSSSRQSVQPTQFVKRPLLRSNNQPVQNLGLGHSSTQLNGQFSRRNSATTTVSHCSSCCSSAGYAPQLRESRVKVLSWASGEQASGSSHSNTNNNTHCEHTDNRRVYEQRACAASRLTAEGQGQVHVASSCNSSSTSSPLPPSCDNELQRLLALQQFRLLNASDCFSSQRQDELRLQRAYDKLGVAGGDSKWHKNRANESRQQPLTTTATTTPYALRQKLLQLRLQQEQAAGRGTGAACAPLERSCALRFNCH
ncbi:uncharacterized protein LOC133838992 [Drosophila sulfurigaster albostrigata]|uniref:uncharacterized protein LOC133838992 n=1 Tax=Drosophila sulfurigaster albostrigata TaxID=89887 RepID=UPI002D21D807|nr:uncharacterized protein LOC133838992 [Drosophila sulfurigaster albostrigata]